MMSFEEINEFESDFVMLLIIRYTGKNRGSLVKTCKKLILLKSNPPGFLSRDGVVIILM